MSAAKTKPQELQLDKTEVKLIEVNHSVCRNLSALLKTQDIPEPEEDNNLKYLSKQEVGNFYLFLVAICHQTTPKNFLPIEGCVGGIYKRGWDYLTAKFEKAIQENRELLNLYQWEKMTQSEFSEIFDNKEQKRELTDPHKRAELIADLGRVMNENNWLWFEDIYSDCRGQIKTGKVNLLYTLDKFQAYRFDPLKKKSLFLLSILRNNYPYWQYLDDNLLGPPVDYHEVRGHLRLGTVEVYSEALRQKLLTQSPVNEEEDEAIRKAVYQAIMLISEMAQLNPSQLHYLFWNVFRCFCKRESPACKESPKNCSFPRRYLHLSVQEGRQRCPFLEVCHNSDSFPRYLEHVFETDYY